MKPTLLYIADPMCSWCYGFVPELNKVLENLEDKIQLKLVMGGLRPYNTEIISEMKDFLQEHWQHVHEASDQEFNFEILDSDELIYDTEPPSRATVVIRNMQPESEYSFFKDAQSAFYAENKNLGKAESYFAILDKYDIDKTRFKDLLNTEEMKTQVKDDFFLAQQLGIRGFPALLVHMNEQFFMISNGYEKAEVLIDRLEGLLSMEEE